jgi:hypothetical protein
MTGLARWQVAASHAQRYTVRPTAMKKRRPPKPKQPRKRLPPASPPPTGKAEVGDLFSTMGTGPVGSSRTSNAPVEAPTGQLAEAKMADRVDTVAAMTNARGWKIFAGFIISWLLVASGVVLFAMHWT